MIFKSRYVTLALVSTLALLVQGARAEDYREAAVDYTQGNQDGVDNSSTPADVQLDQKTFTPAPDVTAAAEETAAVLQMTDDGKISDETDAGKLLQKAKAQQERGDRYFDNNKNLIERALDTQKQLMAKLAAGLHQLSIGFSAKQTLHINPKLGLAVGYSYDTSPAYIGKYWYRQDAYFISTPVHLGDYVKKSVAMLDVTPGVMLEFYRFYDTDSQAKLALPRPPSDFPSNSEKALAMHSGDLAHAQAFVNGVFGAQFVWQLLKKYSLHPQLDYLRNAQVDAYVFRSDNSKVRIRVIAHNQRSVMLEGQLGINANFTPFAWSLLTNAIVHWTRLDQIMMGQTVYGRQNIYLGDYTLDLSQPEVATAYDNLFKKLGLVKDVPVDQSVLLTLLDPRKSIGEMGQALKGNLAELDGLSFDNLKKDPKLQSVTRNFAGSDDAKDKPATQHRVGVVGLYRNEGMTIRRDNKLVRTQMDSENKGVESEDFFFFPTWAKNKDTRALLSLYHRTENQSSNIIYQSDKGFVPTDFRSIGFYLDFTTKSYTDAEHQKQIAHFKQLLPPDVFAAFHKQLEDDDFLSIDGSKIKNVRLKARYFINAKGLEVAQKLFDGETAQQRIDHMRKLIIEHMRNAPTTTYASRAMQQTAGGMVYSGSCDPIYKNEPAKVRAICQEIENITRSLVIVVDKEQAPLARHDQMDLLARNPLFLEAGPGILVGVIPSSDINQATFFEISFYLPSRVEPIQFNYPEKILPERDFYESLLDIQNIMNNTKPDMRLDGDTDNLTVRKTHNPEDGEKFTN